jgi:hypothetical protein
MAFGARERPLGLAGAAPQAVNVIDIQTSSAAILALLDAALELDAEAGTLVLTRNPAFADDC